MDVVILAAGEGTRLLPYTKNTQKCMLPYKGLPILFHTLDSLNTIHGIERVFIVVNYKKESIISSINQHFTKHFNYKLYYLNQSSSYGTANAINKFKDIPTNEFMVINGDTIFRSEDLLKMSGCSGNSVLVMNSDTPEHYGVIDENNGLIVGVVEKPTNPPSNKILSGVYVFTPEIFSSIAALKETGEELIEVDAINNMIKRGIKVQAIDSIGDMIHFSTVEDYENAIRI